VAFFGRRDSVRAIAVRACVPILVAAALTVGGGDVSDAAPATHFTIEAPEESVIGAAVAFTVTARDAAEMVDVAYAGTVQFTSDDPLAILPAPGGLVAGVGVFIVIFGTAGTRTITARDSVDTSIMASTLVEADAFVAVPSLSTFGLILLTTLLVSVALRAIRADRSF